ncbi:MAG: N-acetyl sugar amidotransferase [Nitrospinae bacterium]|nr:N-acetyl sugar amidotransferase [Nitrospinota bacterium]
MATSLEKQIGHLPKEVKFCKKCVVSNQRPRITFDEEGVCSACRYAEWKQREIDWSVRGAELKELCDKYRSKDGSYDVVVPGSGGKDSARVSHMLKHEYGMSPLTVTWAPFQYTDIGFQNFQSFIQSGFDNFLVHPNGLFHRKLSHLAFYLLGDAWQPFAYGQMAMAFRIAMKFGIKLVFFGENGEAEYSGDLRHAKMPGMPLEVWREVYYKGSMVDDVVEKGLEAGIFTPEEIKREQASLQFYRAPGLDEFKAAGAQMHWFAYYHHWVPQENYYYCREHTGFEANPAGRSEGTYSKYASLDDRMDGFHYYLAFMKFGIARTTSDAAHEIRDGHIARDEGVSLVKRYDGEFPKLYYQDFLRYTGITDGQFNEVLDHFRSPTVWKKEGGEWKLTEAVWHPKHLAAAGSKLSF